MKTNPSQTIARKIAAFTLAEMLIVMGLMVVVGGAMILCNLFGLSMSMRQEIWMDATSDTARTIGKLMTDVRSAQMIEVGNYVNGSFVQVPTSTNQWGDALRIFFSTNSVGTTSPPWIDYYYSQSTSNLIRTNWEGAGVPGSYSEVCANPITNDSRIFTLEDALGNTQTVTATIAVVDVYLSYIKFQNPQITIGPGGLVDLYSVRTRITPRIR